MMRRVGAWLALSLSTGALAVILPLISAGRGLSFNNLANIAIVFGLVVVGSLVLARRPGHMLGPIFAIGGTLWAVSGALLAYADYAILFRNSAWPGIGWTGWLGSWLSDVAWALVISFGFLLFPDGRLPSPRWQIVGYVAAASLTAYAMISLVLPGPLSQLPSLQNPLGIASFGWLAGLAEAMLLVFLLCTIASFISVGARYRTAARVEQQQIKWIAYIAIVSALWYAGGELAAAIWQVSLETNLYGIVGNLLLACFPLAIGVAILRHRLFDIDRLINRTLVYGVLTALLALLYAGSVVVLQVIIRVVTGNTQSDLVTVISTLAIAALFGPLRQRIQTIIDRRFYRRKYDAQRTLAAFSARLRDETDLRVLSNDVLTVVHDTLQPAHASLWLKPPAEVRS